MKIEVRIDPTVAETKVTILAARMDEDVEIILKRLSAENPRAFAGFQNGEARLIEPEEIFRVYAAAGRVYAVTGEGEFVLRKRLYEMEDALADRRFVRISNSEIVNLKKVRSFDLSLVGTIVVSFADGTSTYVSRRYVPKIRKVLGI